MVAALSDDGYLYCEITNAAKLLDDTGVFSLYSEYKNIYSAVSMMKLYNRCGISIQRISSINDGEWLGVWGKKYRKATENHFASRLKIMRKGILSLARPIVLWGGGGRGGNILTFLELDTTIIEYVVDLNHAKQNQFIPPYGQRVINPSQLANINPATIIVANDKYKLEIIQMAPSNCNIVSINQLVTGTERNSMDQMDHLQDLASR
jgi:hypothetical protein